MKKGDTVIVKNSQLQTQFQRIKSIYNSVQEEEVIKVWVGIRIQVHPGGTQTGAQSVPTTSPHSALCEGALSRARFCFGETRNIVKCDWAPSSMILFVKHCFGSEGLLLLWKTPRCSPGGRGVGSPVPTWLQQFQLTKFLFTDTFKIYHFSY